MLHVVVDFSGTEDELLYIAGVHSGWDHSLKLRALDEIIEVRSSLRMSQQVLRSEHNKLQNIIKHCVICRFNGLECEPKKSTEPKEKLKIGHLPYMILCKKICLF